MGALCGAEREKPQVEQATTSVQDSNREENKANKSANKNNSNENNNEFGRGRSPSNSDLRRISVPDDENEADSSDTNDSKKKNKTDNKNSNNSKKNRKKHQVESYSGTGSVQTKVTLKSRLSGRNSFKNNNSNNSTNDHENVSNDKNNNDQSSLNENNNSNDNDNNNEKNNNNSNNSNNHKESNSNDEMPNNTTGMTSIASIESVTEDEIIKRMDSDTKSAAFAQHMKSGSTKLAQSIVNATKRLRTNSQARLNGMINNNNNETDTMPSPPTDYARQVSIESRTNTVTHTDSPVGSHKYVPSFNTNINENSPNSGAINENALSNSDSPTNDTSQAGDINNNIKNESKNSKNSKKKVAFSELAGLGIVSDTAGETDIDTNQNDDGPHTPSESGTTSKLDGFVNIDDDNNNSDAERKILASVDQQIKSLGSIHEDKMYENEDDFDDSENNENENDNDNVNDDIDGDMNERKQASKTNNIMSKKDALGTKRIRGLTVDIATQTNNQANFLLAQSPKSKSDQINELIELHKRSKYTFLESATFSKAGTSNGKTKENQDSFFAYDNYGPGGLFQFYGVADGHGRAGHEVSRYVTNKFPQLLVRNEEAQLLLLKDPQLALKKCFLDLEMQLYSDIATKAVGFDIEYSGTTLTCGLRFGNKLYLGNLGDSRTILGRMPSNVMPRKRMLSVPLSVDHDPNAPQEQERIKQWSNAKIKVDEDGYARIDIVFTSDIATDTNNMGTLGTFGATKEDADEKDSKDVDDEFLNDSEIEHISRKQAAMKKVSQKRRASLSKNTLLKPQLNVDYSNNQYIPPPRKSKLIKNLKKISSSVSRSFGDRIAHKYGGLITEPDIRVHEFSDQDCFVIWASDGIWSMMENHEVTDIVSRKLKAAHGEAKCSDLDKVVKKLVNAANVLWNEECEGYTDDITAVIARIGKTSLIDPQNAILESENEEETDTETQTNNTNNNESNANNDNSNENNNSNNGNKIDVNSGDDIKPPSGKPSNKSGTSSNGSDSDSEVDDPFNNKLFVNIDDV